MSIYIYIYIYIHRNSKFLFKFYFISHLRSEAAMIQMEIEESFGVELNFTLHPGDSVFQSFNFTEEYQTVHAKGRARLRNYQDHQSLTICQRRVSLYNREYNSENTGLNLIAEYLQGKDDVDHNHAFPKYGVARRRGSASPIMEKMKMLKSWSFLGPKKYQSASKQRLCQPNPIIVVSTQM